MTLTQDEKQKLAQEMMRDEQARTAVREALQEWLDQKFAEFGKWTAGGLIASALAGAVYLALIGHGWVHR